MTDEPRKTVFLNNAQQGHAVLAELWNWVKPFLLAGWQLSIKVTPKKRTDGQNERFHAICGDIAKSGLQWAGKPRTAAQWKVLLVSGHAVATGEGAEMVPGLENEFVNIRESTAQMSVRRGSSLIEYATAFATTHGVKLNDPRLTEHE